MYNTPMHKDIERQERQYDFPYHYIPEYSSGHFTQSQELFWGYKYLSYVEYITNLVKEMPYESVLEVGCGDGRILHEISRKCPDKTLLGIDTSDRALRFARAFNPGVVFENVDVRDSSEEKQDLTLLIETLEHIDPEVIPEFLKGVASRTRSKLVLTVPSKNVPLISKHYQHFDRQSLSRVLEPYFVIEKYVFLNKKGALLMLKKIISNRFYTVRLTFIWNWFYGLYKKKYFLATENTAERILVIARPRLSSL